MAGGRYIALAVVALLVVGGGFYAYDRLFDDQPAPATVGEALQSFRHSAGGAAGSASPPEGPELGVYRYRTKGGETLDTSFIGTSHDYTGISTIVLTERGCGVVERWQPLATRWSEVETCPAKRGSEFTGTIESHEFFGVREEVDYRCNGPSMTDPPVRRPGARFSSRCEADDASFSSDSRVVGFGKVKVAGRSFEAIHTASRSKLRGYVTGVVVREEWRRRSDGLLLRRMVDADTEVDAAGGAQAREHYEINLLSDEPQR